MRDFNTFLDRCLDGLPKDKYRKRARAELENHLLTLCEELEAAGVSPEDARNRALEFMGIPEQLNASFRTEWIQRASNWKYCLSGVTQAAIHALMLGILIRWFLLMPVTYFGHGVLHDWLNSNSFLPCILFSLVEFLPGFWFASQELHERFSIHPHRRTLVCFGVGLFWLIDAGPMLLGPFMFSMPGLWFSAITGHSQLYFMSLSGGLHFLTIMCCSLTLCLFFALVFRPRKSVLLPHSTPGGDLP